MEPAQEAIYYRNIWLSAALEAWFIILFRCISNRFMPLLAAGRAHYPFANEPPGRCCRFLFTLSFPQVKLKESAKLCARQCSSLSGVRSETGRKITVRQM